MIEHKIMMASTRTARVGRERRRGMRERIIIRTTTDLRRGREWKGVETVKRGGQYDPGVLSLEGE